METPLSSWTSAYLFHPLQSLRYHSALLPLSVAHLVVELVLCKHELLSHTIILHYDPAQEMEWNMTIKHILCMCFFVYLCTCVRYFTCSLRSIYHWVSLSLYRVAEWMSKDALFLPPSKWVKNPYIFSWTTVWQNIRNISYKPFLISCQTGFRMLTNWVRNSTGTWIAKS